MSVQQAHQLLGQIHTEDREKAQSAINRGVEEAEKQWIEAPLIMEALSLGLIALAQNSMPKHVVAGYLKALAEQLESQADLH